MARKKASEFQELKDLWLKRHKRVRKQFTSKHKDSLTWLENSSKHLVAGSLGGLLLLSNPTNPALLSQASSPPPSNEEIVQNALLKKQQFLDELSNILPKQVNPLSPEDEQNIVETLLKYFNIPIKAELEGKRMNTNYGIIGAEQHLMRYPGDIMANHFTSAPEGRFTSSGIAPGRGAWGYFASSRGEMTQQDIDRERYYIAVQTFLSPGYMDHTREF